MKIIKILGVILVFLVGVIIGVEYQKDVTAKALKVANDAKIAKTSGGVTVRAEKPLRRDMIESIRTTGNLEAVDRVDVFSKLPGVITECFVVEGAPIKKGDVMAKLDSREFQLNLRQASSAMNQAVANRDNIRATLERNEQLYADQLISDQQIDQLRTQLKLAESQVRSAKVAKDLASLNLSYATVRAPMDGVVAVKNCEMNKRVTTADNIYEIAAMGNLKVIIFVTEDEVHRLKAGDHPVKISFDALKGTPSEKQYDGKVVFISPVVNPDNGTVEVRVEVVNPDGALTEGMFSRLVIEVGRIPNAMVVPKQSLIGEEGRQQLFVAKEGQGGTLTAHKIDVVAGIEDAEFVTIESPEITDATLVISEGQNLLSEGDRVTPASPMNPQPNAAPVKAP